MIGRDAIVALGEVLAVLPAALMKADGHWGQWALTRARTSQPVAAVSRQTRDNPVRSAAGQNPRCSPIGRRA